jgi:hypothetical protein
VRAPRVKHLTRLDEGIAANLDGLALAGESGCNVRLSTLENTGVGRLFAAVAAGMGSLRAEGVSVGERTG